MKLFARFTDRNGGAVIAPLGVFKTRRYSHSVFGGPKNAEIAISEGNESELWQLRDWLGYRVEIYDERGDTQWWGYVNEVLIQVGAYKVGYSLDRHANSVAVAYTRLQPGATGGGERATTSYITNDGQVAKYGTKQQMLTINSATDGMAENLRTVGLNLLSGEQPVTEDVEVSRANARLILAGHYSKLSWRYYSAANLSQEFDERATGTLTQTTSYTAQPENQTFNMGTNASQKTRHGFVLGGNAGRPMKIKKVKYKGAAIGTSSDNVRVRFYADNAGALGTQTGEVEIPISSIPPSAHGWFEANSASAWVLPAVQYHVEQSRVGSLDDANYFRFASNSAAGYSDGISYYWNGSAWVAGGGLGDLLFELTAEDSESSLAIGAVSAVTMVDVAFTTSTDSAAVGRVSLWLGKAGSPTDDIVVEVCTDNGGVLAPDTVLATATLSATDLSETVAETAFDFAASLLSPSTIYHIKIRRSGGLDSVNYVRMLVNPTTTGSVGETLVYNGSGWGSPSFTCAALIRIGMVQETTEQIRRMAESTGLFSTIYIDAASGVYANPYRDGDDTALTYINELMRAGTVNGLRLLARVDRDRALTIYEEPAQGVNDYYLKRNRQLVDRMGQVIEDEETLTGVWLKLRNIDAAAATSAEQGAFYAFIDECEYDTATDRTRRTYRAQQSIFDLLGVR